jgi:hypothetical protein
MKQFVLIFVLLLFLNCKQDKHQALTANEIIDKSIMVSGGEKFDNSIIEFDFREKHFMATRNAGQFEFISTYKKEPRLKITDYLTNNGFERLVNNKKIILPDSMALRYGSSLNSVHYFSVLPYGLNDEAVNKELLGETSINGANYFKIKVTFNQDGGGEDFEDVFVYWINKETFKVDYLAYSYEEDGTLGFRFREAYNERYVNDLRFVDYDNYKPKKIAVTVYELDNLFENGELELLSKIELKNIIVD